MTHSHEALERKLDWLARQGLTNEAVQKIIRRGPMIFNHSEESLERTKQWILDQGIASSKVCKQRSMECSARWYGVVQMG
jgi:hypothetical protein